MKEIECKHEIIRTFLDRHHLDGLVLQRVASFAWAACGAASYVNTAATFGAASLLVTRDSRHVITNNIEATRIVQEEKLAEQGWIVHAPFWYEGSDVVADLAGGMKLGSDSPFPGAIDLGDEVARLRASLLPEEGERFRQLGRMCAQAMDAAIRAVRPGMTEFEIAALLSQESERRGVQAIVNLIATDERIYNFRHPLPTGKKLDRYAMLVLCGRKWGLVCSLTRLVHFGRIADPELRRKIGAVAAVDAAMISATRPGKTVGAIFSETIQAYTKSGYPDEWKLHHQGGPAAYEPREFIAVQGSPDVVKAGQVFAWNPSITGCKSEDTILVGREENEVLTVIEGWPVSPVSVNGVTLQRPDVLIVD